MPGIGVLIIEDEKIIENSGEGVAQGLGAAQGDGDRQAQGVDVDGDDGFAINYSEDHTVVDAITDSVNYVTTDALVASRTNTTAHD